MIAIVGKLLARPEVRPLPHYSLALDHEDFVCQVLADHPLAPLDTHPLHGIILDLDEVDKRVRAVLRVIKAWHVDHVVNDNAQAFQLFKIVQDP